MGKWPGLLGLFLRCAWLLVAASCGGDPSTGRDRDDNVVYLDGGFEGDGGSSSACPESKPKVGETCGPGVTESTRCEFDNGTCEAANGRSYQETETYCCLSGYWDICASRSPCDAIDAAVPTPADGRPADIAADSLRPAPDAPGDSAVLPADAGVVTVDGSADTQPEAGMSDAASTD